VLFSDILYVIFSKELFDSFTESPVTLNVNVYVLNLGGCIESLIVSLIGKDLPASFLVACIIKVGKEFLIKLDADPKSSFEREALSPLSLSLRSGNLYKNSLFGKTYISIG
jgi:hypothetical protein